MADGGRVVVVGSVNTDLVARVRALPRPGETVSGGDFATVGGGKGANAAVAAARLGARVALVACVGADDFGAARLADLGHEGIDLAGVRRAAGTPSGVALILVDESGQNSIVVVPGANSLLLPAMVEETPFEPRDLLLTQLEVPLAAVEAALRRARAGSGRTILNAAPFRAEAAALLALVDILVVNEIEAADLLGGGTIGVAEAAEAAEALLGRGAGSVAITLGARGAFVAAGKTRRLLPAPAVAAVDTTAAGDAFVGALAAGLADGWEIVAAAERAVIVGSLAVTRAGAQPSLPTLAEVEAFAGGG